MSPSFNSDRFSLANVEKVVNPPQNPTVRNILIPGLIRSPLSDIPYMIPIRKLPKMFTVNVPQGNAAKKVFCTKRERRYLEIPPKKLPVPINKSILNIFSTKVDKIINFVKIE